MVGQTDRMTESLNHLKSCHAATNNIPVLLAPCIVDEYFACVCSPASRTRGFSTLGIGICRASTS